MTQNEQPQVTSTQPLRHITHEADSFFDFDIDNESPGSPAEECEYSRLIETTSNTPHTPHDAAPESGYVCASPISPEGSLASQSSSEGQFFDPESSDTEQRSITGDYYDCVEAAKKDNSSSISSNSQATLANGSLQTIVDSDSFSESLPPSQSTVESCTAPSSASNSTLQDVQASELETPIPEKVNTVNILINGTCEQNGFDEDDDSDTINDSDNVTTVIPNGHIPKVSSSHEISSLDVDRKYIMECLHTNDIDIKLELSLSPEPDQESQDADRIQLEILLQENLQVPDDVTNDENKSTSPDIIDDIEESRPQRVRRCSSLKTGKTPPGTPSRKKIVRFADALGLDLADVRTFLDDIPKIPKSAFDDLDVTDLMDTPSILGPQTDKMLMPLFQQPGGLPNFLDMVRNKLVCLENAAVTDPVTLTITGSVRVRNLDFHKSVYIRYSLDSWQSFSDLQTNYVDKSCDGFSDKFSFVMFGNSLQYGQRLELAVRFHCKGQQYWDNNYGQNYVFQCLPTNAIQPVITTVRPSATADEWCQSFY